MPGGGAEAQRGRRRGQERDARSLRRGLSRTDRTTSRKACARRSARCASACACGARRPMLSGSACCVYGLTFTSHFYGARRTVGYVPFNSETLVTGKLFEDIREAVFKLADPALYDAIVITNLCVPTASGVPLRPAAEGDQRRPHHRHRRAGLRRADPCRGQGRAGRRDARICPHGSRAGAGAGAARRQAASGRPSRCVGEMFPADPVGIGMMLEPLGLAAGPVVPTREWRELYAALDCAVVAAIHPFYTASLPRIRGRPGARSSAPRRSAMTAPRPGSKRSATACGVAPRQDRRRQEPLPAGDQGGAGGKADQGPHHAVRLRRLGAAGRTAADRERRRRAAMSAPPARARTGRMPTASGWRRKGVARPVPRLARAGPRRASTSSSPTSPSAPRRSCRRPRSWRSRRSTSPT